MKSNFPGNLLVFSGWCFNRAHIFNNAFGLKAIICLGISFWIIWRLKNTLYAPHIDPSFFFCNYFVSVFAFTAIYFNSLAWHFNCHASQSCSLPSTSPRSKMLVHIPDTYNRWRFGHQKKNWLNFIPHNVHLPNHFQQESIIHQPFVGELFGDGVPLADSLLTGNGGSWPPVANLWNAESPPVNEGRL